MEKTFKDYFGERLKERREACGFPTVEKLAKAIGVRGQTISNYENAHTLPDAHNLFMLSRALDCTVDYLTLKEDDPTHEVASIAALTGLSPKAAAALIELNKTPDKSIQFFISAVLSSKYAYSLSVSFLMLIDTIGKEREKAGGTIGEPCTHDDLDEYFEHRHMIDGARYGADHQFNLFLDETEQRAMDLDMEADDGKGEE